MGVRPYPLLLEPLLLEKVWGGDRLSRLGKRLPHGKLIGESWELADLGSTSPSGGGGAAARSTIVNGDLAGKSLYDAIKLWGRDLVGEIELAPCGGFPLLVKFLDARENLSVQVHPSPAYARAHRDAHLKTEAWYILDAEPGSVIYKGLRPGLTREAFAAHIQSGTVVEDLIPVPAIRGECHLLPSGTCHALGAGVLVAEVQTPSDTTFRVYDWGRQGRELHIQQALECAHFGPAPDATRRREGHAWGRLCRTEYFDLFEFLTPAPVESVRDYKAPRRPAVLQILEGSARIGGIPAPAGATVLVPAYSEATLAAAAGTRILVTVVKGSRASTLNPADG
jgi:mannose-6-phosphate isomerase